MGSQGQRHKQGLTGRGVCRWDLKQSPDGVRGLWRDGHGKPSRPTEKKLRGGSVRLSGHRNPPKRGNGAA